MAKKSIEYVSEMDLQSCINKMKSTLKELQLQFKMKDSETEKKISLKIPYYLQEIKIEILFYNSGNKTTISLTGKSDDLFGKGIIKNFDLIMSKFNGEKVENQELYTIENTTTGNYLNDMFNKFLGLNLYLKIILVSTFVVLIFQLFNSDDCKSLSGKIFSQSSLNQSYKWMFTYEFQNENVTLSSGKKSGTGEWKFDNSQNGKYKLEGDRIIMNFGGNDVYMTINRSSGGCISSISNNSETYRLE